MIIYTLLGIVVFILLNLLVTVVLRYRNNDGWLEYYRRKALDKGVE